MCVFVILAHFRISQGNRTDKENLHLKITGIVLCKNKLNLSLIVLILQVFDPWLSLYELMKIQVPFSTFWIFNGGNREEIKCQVL